jgi:hypothetical protein
MDRNEIRAMILKALEDGILKEGKMKNKFGAEIKIYYFTNI